MLRGISCRNVSIGASDNSRRSASCYATGQPSAGHVFGEADYAAYLDLLAEWSGLCGIGVWAYCLMPNHVHLVVVVKRTGAPGRDRGPVGA
jgi:hypothetical protein